MKLFEVLSFLWALWQWFTVGASDVGGLFEILGM